MNRLLIFLFLMAGIALTVFTSCEEEKNANYLVDLEGYPDEWNYVAYSDDGSQLWISHQDGVPDMIYYLENEDDDGYPLFLDERGYPEMVMVNDFIFRFQQIDTTHLDIAMITPDNEIIVSREIEVDTSWPAQLQSGLGNKSFANAIRWSGTAASVAGCALSKHATMTDEEVVIPAINWGCGSMVINFATRAFESDAVGVTSEEAGIGSAVLGCTSDFLDCVMEVARFLSAQLNGYLEDAENRNQQIIAATGALMGGHGDIQITLSWNNTADIDLHVIDPTGFEIYYADPVSPSGGYLDYDNMSGFGPENVFWEENTAPGGEYQVYVNHYKGDDPSLYTVVINAFGSSSTFSGTLQTNQKVHVANFSETGIDSKNLVLTKTIGDKPEKNK